MLKAFLKKIIPLEQRMYLRGLQQSLVGGIYGRYSRWIKKYDQLNDSDRQTIIAAIATFAYQPLISVVVPVYKPNQNFFRLAVESVQKQLYQNWELILVDDASADPAAKMMIDQFVTEDSRIKPIYLEKNQGISGATNEGIKIAQGEFIAFMDHDDMITEDALYQVVKALNKTSADILYSDADHLDSRNKRYTPYFKPDWDPYLLLFQHYMCHFFIARKSLIEEVGGLRTEFNGSQDWDLALRLVEKTNKITHIPLSLYHWRRLMGGSFSQKNRSKTELAAKRAVEEHLKRRNISAAVKFSDKTSYPDITFALPAKLPLVSIIIPTKDGLEMLRDCVKSIFDKIEKVNFEIIIVNNNSTRADIMAYFEEIRSEQVKVLDYPYPFNYSAINNFAVKEAKGEVLLFLNDDVEAISAGWVDEMLSVLLQKDVGIVGAKLYYPNLSIQHAGVILGEKGAAVHVHARLRHDQQGYFSKIHHMQCFSAVTAACLMIKKSLFEQVGGFDEKLFPITFNDIDLCIKVREAGYRIVFNPHVELYHKESATRGNDTTPEKSARAEREAQSFVEKWGVAIENDPYYNPNFSFSPPGYALAFPPRIHRGV